MTAASRSFSDAIRAAAGYAPIAPTRATEPVGDVGIGRGGGAMERRPPSPTMSALIRATRAERVERIRELAVYDYAGRPWVG
jgi:hypothetical protein